MHIKIYYTEPFRGCSKCINDLCIFVQAVTDEIMTNNDAGLCNIHVYCVACTGTNQMKHSHVKMSEKSRDLR
jgi:hypothetical protein